MARARNIKPSFFMNEQLGELEPIARLLFIGMWTIADFKGCIEYRPLRIKAQLMPYDDCDIKKLTNNLELSGVIKIYSVDDKNYIKILNFEKHQNPHKNERDSGSLIPDITQVIDLKELTINPDLNVINPECSASARADSLLLIPDSLLLIPESAPSDSALVPVAYMATRANERFPITKTDLIIYEDAYPAVDIISEFKKMIAWLHSNPAKRKTMGGMKKFINAWLSRANDNPLKQPKRESLKEFVFDETFRWDE